MTTWVALFLMVLFFLWLLRSRGPAQSALSFGRSSAREVRSETVTFNDVAGVDEATEELQEVVDFLKNPGRYSSIGARIPKGVLLVGPPGTGKTLLARAVAGEAGVPFFQMSGSEFVEMFVGVGAARVRDTFKKARASAPCIVFIDELDALGKARGSGAISHEEREQTLNQLLVEMDGFDPSAGIIVMSATNRPEILDGALMRAGRFDRHIMVDRPSLQGRIDILRIHMRQVSVEDDLDVDAVAARTPGFAGADLANLVNEAALLAARHNKDIVSMAEFEEAIERAQLGLQKRGILLSDKERKIIAYHELGHAVAAEIVGDPVNKVTIIPRGMALGVTWHQPNEDRHIIMRSELDNKITVLLGGRAAEQLFIGEPSTGAHDDLARATAIASDMVRKYGMSELGSRTFDHARPALVNEDLTAATQRDHGGQTANSIDREVQQIIETGLKRATDILESHREGIDRLASLLLDKQEISGSEVRQGLGLAERSA